MKLKLIELVQVYPVLTKIGNEVLKDADMAYEMALALSEAENQIKAFEKGKLAVAKKYGKLDEKTNNMYAILPDKIADAEREIGELGEKEVELNLRKFTKENFKEFLLTPNEIKVMLILEDKDGQVK